MDYHVNSSKGQLKIQQMAFVLVAMIIFFALVALVYFSVRVNSLKKEATSLQEDQAKELVQKLSGISELKWTKDCSTCVDMDKALLLKNRTVYKGFFGLDYLAFEVIYPAKTNRECTIGNYPDCSKLTLINGNNFGTASNAYVSLCRWNQDTGNEKCELGIIYAGGNAITG